MTRSSYHELKGKNNYEVKNVKLRRKIKFHFPLIDEKKIQKSPNKSWNSSYTNFNFLPKSIYNQLKQFTNFYFICEGILEFIPSISGVNPWGTLAPLLLIFSLSIYKEFIGHLSYLKSDEIKNNKLRKVYRYLPDENNLKNNDLGDHIFKMEKTLVKNQDIRAGDIVEVSNNEDFPCDLAFIKSSREDNECYISTANLDGETSLKCKYSSELEISIPKVIPKKIRYSNHIIAPNITNITPKEIHEIKSPNFVAEFDAPDQNINNFEGFIVNCHNSKKNFLALNNCYLPLVF